MDNKQPKQNGKLVSIKSLLNFDCFRLHGRYSFDLPEQNTI